MTCWEKYKKDHGSGEKKREVVKTCCPDMLPMPPYCENASEEFLDRYGCNDCWDREIPETQNNETTESVERQDNNDRRILDSGDRTEFRTGAVRDMRVGKGRCDLLPLDVVSFYFGSYDECIIDGVNYFQNTGDTNHLYKVLADFNMCVYGDAKTMFLEVSVHFEDGAKKYGENNWRKGIPVYCYIDSAVRHYLKYLRGDKDERHDRAFVWNILCAIWTCEHMPELNGYAAKKDKVRNENTCVSCGNTIPEGKQVCPSCIEGAYDGK